MFKFQRIWFLVSIITSINLVALGASAQFQNRQQSPQSGRSKNRVVFLRGYQRVYPFLPAYGIRKSMDQMKAEAMAGRNAFKSFYTSGAIPQRGLIDRRFMTPVKDQGQRGTCVAFASVGVMEVLAKELSNQNTTLSEQYVYWASKEIAKVNPNADGSDPLSMLQSIDKNGAPPEVSWPYDKIGWWANPGHKDCVDAYKLDPVNMNVPTECVTNGAPPEQARRADKLRIRGEKKIATSPEYIIGYLNNNIPVEVGVDVYQSSWHMDNPGDPANLDKIVKGVVDMPQQGEMPVAGHAVVIVGYSLPDKVYYFKNSWGTNEWAARSTTPYGPGYGTIPMDYIRQFGEAAVAQLSPVKAP